MTKQPQERLKGGIESDKMSRDTRNKDLNGIGSNKSVIQKF